MDQVTLKGSSEGRGHLEIVEGQLSRGRERLQAEGHHSRLLLHLGHGCVPQKPLPPKRSSFKIPHPGQTSRTTEKAGRPGRVCSGRAAQTLTAVRVVPYDVVPPTPVPQQQGRVAGPGHDVAVPSDVRLGPGQARDHVPVAEHNLSQLPWNTETAGWTRSLPHVPE